SFHQVIGGPNFGCRGCGKYRKIFLNMRNLVNFIYRVKHGTFWQVPENRKIVRMGWTNTSKLFLSTITISLNVDDPDTKNRCSVFREMCLILLFIKILVRYSGLIQKSPNIRKILRATVTSNHRNQKW